MVEFRTEGQRQMFVSHLLAIGAVTMEEYMLLVSLARGTHPAVAAHFRGYVDRMCAERPELAIAARTKYRILKGV